MMLTPDTSVDAQAFDDSFLHGETILWCGRPAQGFVLTPRDFLLVPFSSLWFGFTIFWEWLALEENSSPIFLLFGLCFILIGLFLLLGRFLLDAWLRNRTIYAMTERRILIRRSGPWPSLKVIELNRLPITTLDERTDGRGTIRFGEQTSIWAGRAAGVGAWVAALDPTPQFLMINDARAVFATIQKRAQGE